MFKPNTVIVLGAAVSAEVGLPLGWDLKSKIAGMLPRASGTGDDHVRYALFSGVGPDVVNRRVKACEDIRRALPKAASIDNLVEHRGADADFKVCAKVGIVSAILRGERDSKLFRKPTSPRGSLDADQTTYADLFRIMVGNAPWNRLSDALDRVSFINFNYDRCLEHFLTDWLCGYSGLQPKEADDLVTARLNVLRPYGSVGTVAFGADIAGVDLCGLSESILTFSEERGSDVDLAVQQMLRGAGQVIFLGCAYHPQNMKLLTPPETRFMHGYGTCYTPPPPDPAHLSAPSLQDFADPTRRAFEGTLRGWKRTKGGQVLVDVIFEPLTSRQLIAKWAPRWIDG